MAHTTTNLIFIPLPVIGHMKPTIELAKLLINRNQHLSATILIMQPPSGLRTGSPIATYIQSLTNKTTDRTRFIMLSQDEPIPKRDPKSPMTFVNDYINSHCKHVTNIVDGIVSQRGSGGVAGFVIDMLCTGMMDMAKGFDVPTYVFDTSSAAYLGFQLYVQSLCDDRNQDVVELSNSGEEVLVPGFVNPVPTKVFPAGYDTKEGVDYVLLTSRKLREAKAIMVNTFLEFETHAIESLTSDKSIPRVYPVGPIVSLVSDGGEECHDDVIKWLDDQPCSSVVYLCFGSLGGFDEVQVKEIAHALERSSHRFLWSLRQPPSPRQTSRHLGDYEDLSVVLPEGFLERTAEIGKVIGWAPQVAVLAHSAVGGFVTHCGWNSVLESLWFGVPVAVWPIYAEQHMNAFEMVLELGLGVEIRLDYKKDLFDQKSVIVTSEEIESGVRRLMDDNEIRGKTRGMGKMSRSTMSEGGSSYVFVDRLIQDFIGNIS